MSSNKLGEQLTNNVDIMFDDFREVLGDAVCVNCQDSVSWRGIRERLDRQIADTTVLYMSKVRE